MRILKGSHIIIGFCVLILLGRSQGFLVEQKEVYDAFEKSIGTYLRHVQQKSPEAEKVFDQITTEKFQAYLRREEVLDKARWKDYMRALLAEYDESRYEYRVVYIHLVEPTRAIVRLDVLEIKHWRDSNGTFGPAGQVLLYQEHLTWDCEFVKVGSEWKWNRFARYGFGKEAHEEVFIK